MTPITAESAPAPQYSASPLAAAIETDRAYFELGATIERVPGAVLAWMPGLTHVPAGAVVHRVDPQTIADIGEAWVRDTEGSLSAVGVGLARIYLDSRDDRADDVLRRAGYIDRDELVFHHRLSEPPPGLTLRRVTSDADWARKLLLHEAVATSPDGHRNPASDWVALERRKSEHGMDVFLAEIHGETVGAIGTVWGRELLRMKNIVVHPAHRRRAVAQSILAHAAAIGGARGVCDHCVLAVRGEAGESLYRAAGMQAIGVQVEWSKRIMGSGE